MKRVDRADHAVGTLRDADQPQRDETVGVEKQPYDPRIHFVLINEAYKSANPGNTELAKWLDAQLATFDKIYGGKRPRYIEGYNKLKEAIKPWGTK